MNRSAERGRRRLTAQALTGASRDLLVAGGPSSVVVREVARSLGVVPSALYKHVAGRDGLLTLLVAALYDEVAQACEQAVAAVPPERHRGRLLAASTAVRQWASAHPAEFDLLFGHPVPGYAAPEGGPNDQAARRFSEVFFQIFSSALASGHLRVRDDDDLPGDLAEQLRRSAPADGPAMSPGQYYPMVMGYQRMIGLVAVDVTGQLRWALADPRPLTDEQLGRLVEELLTPDP